MKRYGIAFLFLVLGGLFAACTSSEKIIVINNTSHTFCKVERTPNLSIYAPWQKKTSRIRLHPGETVSLSGGDENHILYLLTCDERYMVSNYRQRPEPGEPWVLTDSMVADMAIEFVPTPMATRIPVVLTIINDTGRDICSVRFSRWREPYQFSDNVLTRTMIPGDQIVLREPEDINWGTYVLKIYFCDETEYLTEAVVFEEIMAITLRGEEFDTLDLLTERRGEGQ